MVNWRRLGRVSSTMWRASSSSSSRRVNAGRRTNPNWTIRCSLPSSERKRSGPRSKVPPRAWRRSNHPGHGGGLGRLAIWRRSPRGSSESRPVHSASMEPVQPSSRKATPSREDRNIYGLPDPIRASWLGLAVDLIQHGPAGRYLWESRRIQGWIRGAEAGRSVACGRPLARIPGHR